MSAGGLLIILMVIALPVLVVLLARLAGLRGPGTAGPRQETATPVMRAVAGPLAGQEFILAAG